MLLPLILTAFLQSASPGMSVQPSSAALVEKGLESYRRVRLHEAASYFRRAVVADPQNAAAHWYLGYTLYLLSIKNKAPERV